MAGIKLSEAPAVTFIGKRWSVLGEGRLLMRVENQRNYARMPVSLETTQKAKGTNIKRCLPACLIFGIVFMNLAARYNNWNAVPAVGRFLMLCGSGM